MGFDADADADADVDEEANTDYMGSAFDGHAAGDLLPVNVKLLTLQALSEGEFLMRVENIFAVDEVSSTLRRTMGCDIIMSPTGSPAASASPSPPHLRTTPLPWSTRRLSASGSSAAFESLRRWSSRSRGTGHGRAPVQSACIGTPTMRRA